MQDYITLRVKRPLAGSACAPHAPVLLPFWPRAADRERLTVEGWLLLGPCNTVNCNHMYDRRRWKQDTVTTVLIYSISSRGIYNSPTRQNFQDEKSQILENVLGAYRTTVLEAIHEGNEAQKG